MSCTRLASRRWLQLVILLVTITTSLAQMREAGASVARDPITQLLPRMHQRRDISAERSTDYGTRVSDEGSGSMFGAEEEGMEQHGAGSMASHASSPTSTPDGMSLDTYSTLIDMLLGEDDAESSAPTTSMPAMAMYGYARPQDSTSENNEADGKRSEVVEPIIVPQVAPCLGCKTTIREDSSELRRVTSAAAKLLEDHLETQYTFKTTQVFRASKQVVGGIKYFLTLEVAQTNCRRPPPAFTLCIVPEATERHVYHLSMLYPAGSDRAQLRLIRPVVNEEVAGMAGIFASSASTGSETLPMPTPAGFQDTGDSLLDILMGLDSAIQQQQQQNSHGSSSSILTVEQPDDAEGELHLHGDQNPLVIHREKLVDKAPIMVPKSELVFEEVADDRTGSALPEDADVFSMLDLPTSGERGEGDSDVNNPCRSARQFQTREVQINVRHPRVQDILRQFLEEQERSASNRLVITDFISARQQMMTEISYQFEFVLGTSDCLKNTTRQRQQCSANDQQPLSQCRVRVLERPGHRLQFNSVSCISNKDVACNNRGCQSNDLYPYSPAYSKSSNHPRPVDIHDPSYYQLVQHVQSEVNRRSRRPFLHKFMRTLNATKIQYNLQESAEMIEQDLYSLSLRFMTTDCRSQEEEEVAQSCVRNFRYRKDLQTIECDVRVSSLSWANRMRVLDLFCESTPVE